MTQHYNKGIVWGKILSATEDHMKDKNDETKQIVCANLQISCPGDFGKVNVFAKVMREADAKMFLEENNSGKTLRLDGFFAQYKDRAGAIKSNYNILSWGPCSSRDANDLRAVFILVGRVDDVIACPDDEHLITLTTERVVNGRTYTNAFSLGTEHPDSWQKGETYRVKGELRAIEDRFGDTISVRPLILEAKKIEEQGVPALAGEDGGPIPF